jgi:hypothetical protein
MHLLFAAGVAPQVVPEAGVAIVKSPGSVWPMPALSEIATDWLLVTVSVLAGVVMLPQPSSQTLAFAGDAVLEDAFTCSRLCRTNTQILIEPRWDPRSGELQR